MREEDRERDLALMLQAFHHPLARTERYLQEPLEHGRVIVENGEVVGGLRFEPLAQFFGGRAVRSALIFGVKIAPEARGRGLGSILMRDVLAEVRADGIAMSTLYPSDASAYRRFGYELAGAHVRYLMPVAALRSRSTHSVEPWDDLQLDEVARCYQQVAERSSGLIDRSPVWWHKRLLLEAAEQRVYRYLVRTEGGVRGYIIHTQEPDSAESAFQFAIEARDLQWLDGDACQALLAYVAANRALGTQFRWPGGLDDPLSLMLESQRIRIASSYTWMSRLVHVAAALEARAYPAHVEAEVELVIDDPVLRENSGGIRLEVAAGRARVSAAPAASARADVGVFSALFTGWLSAGDAARLGRLAGAGPAEIGALERIFAGPKPRLVEMF
jgi:predicted acetyltransferase